MIGKRGWLWGEAKVSTTGPACPRCEAPAGQACRTPTGRTTDTHAARMTRGNSQAWADRNRCTGSTWPAPRSTRRSAGYPYLVGSVLYRPDYRDVDLRLLMCEARGGTAFTAEGTQSRFLNAAISDWLRSVTDLPIDFQFQTETEWDSYDGLRNPMGLAGVY